MKDYQELMAKHPYNSIDVFTGKILSGTPDKTIDYLDKYWLDKHELDKEWSVIKNTIFKGDFWSYSDMIFRDEFETIILKGGSLFYEEYYKHLQSCIKNTGDSHFVTVEDFNINNPPGNHPPTPGLIDWPPLRFKYPADVSYDEMLSGEFVSGELIRSPHRDYFVFGNSGQWGIYSGNDFRMPLHIIGFKKEFSELFHNHFEVPAKDVEEIKEWIKEDIKEIDGWRRANPGHYP